LRCVAKRLTEQWSAQQVLQLYQARWHIELLFKRIKQLLHLHRLRCHTAPSARATLASLLLGWALQEEEVVQARFCLQQAGRELEAPTPQSAAQTSQSEAISALSEWSVAVLCLDQLRGCVRGSFSREQLHACWPRLQRFVRGSPRRRRHWYTECCRWLTTQQAPPVEALV
jgi:hypothetical protein